MRLYVCVCVLMHACRLSLKVVGELMKFCPVHISRFVVVVDFFY